MEHCLDEVLRVIQECMQFSDSHIHYIDKAVICLKVLCWQLSDLLNEVVVNGGLDQEDQNDLNQLHWCLCQLC